MLHQIAKQEKALTHDVAEAVKAGLSASVIQSVTAQLSEELDALRRHRAMLDSWRVESARESQRMRYLWEVAEGAHERLPRSVREIELPGKQLESRLGELTRVGEDGPTRCLRGVRP